MSEGEDFVKVRKTDLLLILEDIRQLRRLVQKGALKSSPQES
jgi:hypothetical protein